MTPEQAAWVAMMLIAAIAFLTITALAEWLARTYTPFGDWVERMIERIAR